MDSPPFHFETFPIQKAEFKRGQDKKYELDANLTSFQKTLFSVTS